MLKSMTGFGQAESKSRQGHTRVEIKATNHKFFELSLRLPGHLAEFEETLQHKLGTKVRIVHGKKRGKIEIEYFSLEDLDRVLKVLGLTSTL